jgi:hypothetical protein
MATYPIRLHIVHVLSLEKKFTTETDWIVPGDSTLSGWLSWSRQLTCGRVHKIPFGFYVGVQIDRKTASSQRELGWLDMQCP